jgi:hypothetical protein
MAQFRAAERALAQQVAEFEALKNDPELRREIEFDDALNRFLEQQKMSRSKLLAHLQLDDEQGRPAKTARSAPRKKQEFKERIFRNPHTNETLKVKSTNHGTFREWTALHGKDVVQSWEVTA